MKFNNIKNTTRKAFCALAISATILGSSSCTDNFERINKNPLYPDKEMEKMDDVIYGMYIPNLQKTVIPTGTSADGTNYINKYQFTINMCGDSWAGYLSATENKFDGGQNLTSYFFADWRMNGIFSTIVTEVFTPWMQIQKLSQTEGAKNDEIFSIAQIIKISGLHRATDTFGALPYSKVGTGNFHTEYDSQEDIYKSFFAELEQAINVLTIYSESSSKILEDFDIVYNGDVNKWIKYANSLMLRLAIRVRYADEALGQKYAELAVNHPKGLIEQESEAAQLSKGAGMQMRNSLEMLWNSYNDTKMGATIYTLLKGYNDPRISAYFKKATYNNKEDYYAVRTGIPQVSHYKNFSAPNVQEDTPTYWMKASEVLFLRAEGALAGWNMKGSVKDLYEEGIRMSFKENKVSGVENYIKSNNKPASYEDPADPSMSISAPSSVTVKLDNTFTSEEILEKIITQKYIASFPNGTEAWTEWRRTGYPKQIVITQNLSNSDIVIGNGVTGGVRRLQYPKTEYDNNFENVKDAVNKYLNGKDKGNINVWWDKKNNK